jgi:hypothetical protein
MPDEKRAPSLDVSKVSFPTDQLTIAKLRQVNPGLFQGDVITDKRLLDSEVLATLQSEMILAQKAFAATLKIPDPHPWEDSRNSMRLLDEEYRRYGLSAGHQQTRQLIRGFLDAAVKQAKSLRGPSR